MMRWQDNVCTLALILIRTMFCTYLFSLFHGLCLILNLNYYKTDKDICNCLNKNGNVIILKCSSFCRNQTWKPLPSPSHSRQDSNDWRPSKTTPDSNLWEDCYQKALASTFQNRESQLLTSLPRIKQWTLLQSYELSLKYCSGADKAFQGEDHYSLQITFTVIIIYCSWMFPVYYC